MIVLHAFSQSKCDYCEADITTPHIPSYRVCNDCSEEHGVCEQCGKALDFFE